MTTRKLALLLVDRFLESAHMRGIPSKQHGVYILVQ
jgi:hypothetical protein